MRNTLPQHVCVQDTAVGVVSFVPPGMKSVSAPKRRKNQPLTPTAEHHTTHGSKQKPDKQKQAGTPAPRTMLKSGELVHAEASVPVELWQQVYGKQVDRTSFAGLGLALELADHLEAINFSQPTLIQQQAIPPLLVSRLHIAALACDVLMGPVSCGRRWSRL